MDAPADFFSIASVELRHRPMEIFDSIEYGQRNGVLYRGNRVIAEVLNLQTYQRYCEVTGLDPEPFERVVLPGRATPHSAPHPVDWDRIVSDRIELDSTYVRRELRVIQARVAFGGLHVRVQRHGRACCVLAPADWTSEARDQERPQTKPRVRRRA